MSMIIYKNCFEGLQKQEEAEKIVKLGKIFRIFFCEWDLDLDAEGIVNNKPSDCSKKFKIILNLFLQT